MKKISLIMLLAACSTIILQAETIQKANVSPQQLKTRLLAKYQGKINGINNLSRVGGSSKGAVAGAAVGAKIDEAVNRLIGMDSIDLDGVEKDIESIIHKALTSIFQQSIDLALKTYRHEKSDKLFAIAPWNNKIVWNQAQTHVLMLTWIPAAYQKTYQDHLQSGQEMTITWDAWVTAVPEVKEFAQKYASTAKDGFNLTHRVEQFLGLIPSKPPYAISQNKLFVEMWVRPEDLFRPCLDAETIDSECALDPHESDLKNLPPAYRDMSKFISMTPAHKQWFDKEKQGKYTGQWAMPWTRFGYTYDWGSAKKAQGKREAQGASEYLIKSGSKVTIQSIIPTDDYPSAATPASGYIYKE